jgi:hypothetical protein
MATSKLPARERVAWGRFWWVSLLAVGSAIAANLLALFFLDLFVEIPADFPPFQPAAIATVTAIGVMGASIAFAIVGGVSQQPRRTFTLVAVVALLVTLIPNLLAMVNPAGAPVPGMTAQAAALLMVFHVVAAVVAVLVLTRLGLEPAPPPAPAR